MLCIAGPRCGPVRASPGGKVEKIVVAGGHRTAEIIEVYDISANSWQTGAFNFYHVADIKGES